METTAQQNFIHTGPRKLRLVADMVRKLSPLKALQVLEFTPKYAAKDLSNAIKTALANAKQKGLSADSLIFKSLEINESLKMRRFRAGTRGRVKPFKRRMAHIKIVLSDEIGKSEVQNVSKSVSQKASASEDTGTLTNRNTDIPISSDLSEKNIKKVKKEKK